MCHQTSCWEWLVSCIGCAFAGCCAYQLIRSLRQVADKAAQGQSNAWNAAMHWKERTTATATTGMLLMISKCMGCALVYVVYTHICCSCKCTVLDSVLVHGIALPSQPLSAELGSCDFAVLNPWNMYSIAPACRQGGSCVNCVMPSFEQDQELALLQQCP
jgi:hypothetical protein